MKTTKSHLLKSLLVTLAALGFWASLGAMIFRPEKGAMWDPSILWHDGQYYAFMMYDTDGDDAYCLLATSPDGVHWADQGTIVSEHDRTDGSSFFKCFVAKCGDKFIMDHGVGWCVNGHTVRQNEMRFYQSKDLRHWEYITSTHPNERWYRQDRWDHMYMLPKEEGKPEAGYWGYVVAVPKQGAGIGMKQSQDGYYWEVLPPAPTEWGNTPPKNYFEYGGCERIGGKYYLLGNTFDYMGSKGYNTFTLIADGPRGPFRPDPEAYRLSGTSGKNLTWAACWVRGNGELLISNYTWLQHDVTKASLLPLRKPIIDQAGHLRLGWWKGNEAIKGQRVQLVRKSVGLTGKGKPGGYDVQYLKETFDLGQGLVLEGKITARAMAPGDKSGSNPVAGFVIEEKSGQALAVQLGIGPADSRETNIGRLTTKAGGQMEFSSEDVTGKGCATVTGLDEGHEHTFRLLCRLGMLELYIDDMLMQTYVYQPGGGKVGFLAGQSQAQFSEVCAWAMSFPATPAGTVPTPASPSRP